MLRYINDNAVATKEPYTLTFDLSNSVAHWEGPEGERSEDLKYLSGVDLMSKGIVREGSLTLDAGPSGFMEPIKVLLSDGEDSMAVEFNPISGRTKIKEAQKE